MTFYVCPAATGKGDGSSWEDAFPSLAAAEAELMRREQERRDGESRDRPDGTPDGRQAGE